MPSGSPPSSRPYLAKSQELQTAQGTLREGLGSLMNLDRLLKSIRVGPKALVAVLPDVFSSCKPMVEASETLLSAIGRELSEHRADAALLDFMSPRLYELSEAVERALTTTMNAKNRLALSEVVGRLATDLSSAHTLIELLAETLWEPAVSVGFLDLLREAFEQPPPTPQTRPTNTATIVVAGVGEHTALTINPRSAMGVFRIAAGIVAQKTDAVGLTIQLPAGGGVQFECAPGGGDGTRFRFVPERIVAPTLACVQAVVTEMGGTFEQAGGDTIRVVCRGQWLSAPG